MKTSSEYSRKLPQGGNITWKLVIKCGYALLALADREEQNKLP